MARPTKYKKKYCQEIIDYFLEAEKSNIKTEVISESYYKDGTLKDKKYKLIADNLPFFSSFADKIGVHYDTLNEWMKVHEEFSDAYKKAKSIQKRVLIKNGLSGIWNPAFAIFTAKNITDMRDKKELGVDVGDELKELILRVINAKTNPINPKAADPNSNLVGEGV